MKTIRELLETTEFASLAHSVKEDAERTREALEIMDPPAENPSELVYLNGVVPRAGLKQMKDMCVAWNVSTAALVRIAVHELAVRHRFRCDAMLIEKDILAISRNPRARRPLTDVEETDFRKRRALIVALEEREAESFDRGDAPQSS